MQVSGPPSPREATERSEAGGSHHPSAFREEPKNRTLRVRMRALAGKRREATIPGEALRPPQGRAAPLRGGPPIVPAHKKPMGSNQAAPAARANIRLLLLPSGPDKVHTLALHEFHPSSHSTGILYSICAQIATPFCKFGRIVFTPRSAPSARAAAPSP